MVGSWECVGIRDQQSHCLTGMIWNRNTISVLTNFGLPDASLNTAIFSWSTVQFT